MVLVSVLMGMYRLDLLERMSLNGNLWSIPDPDIQEKRR